MKQGQMFGGDWTDEKLERVRRYLVEYTKIMAKQRFRFAYIDAFAGTGYRELRREDNPKSLMFPELVEPESQRFLDGSARIALQVQPTFTEYIFVERDRTRFAELEKLKSDFLSLQSSITLENKDANDYIKDLCLNRNWRQSRAVLFLDPYGMQVTWDTIVAVAGTKAIDLWILFPLGVAVNRLLRRDGDISRQWMHRLDLMFGTRAWYDAFYQTRTSKNLFGEERYLEKVADFEAIGRFFVERLKTVFPGVAENPLPLLSSRNNPLYLLCFAAGNDRGAPIAIRIAQYILRM